MSRIAALVLAASLVGAGTLRAQDAAAVRTTLDGVYTTEQAARGREVYERVCSECHELDWYGPDLMGAWVGAPVFSLYDLIRTSMPEDNPGGLRPAEYVDMIAYILELNGMPPGNDELTPRVPVLQGIIVRRR